MIKSNLKEVLDSRHISIRHFSGRIDYRFESVRQMYNGTMTRYPAKLLDRACRELNCPVGVLITFVPTSDDYQGLTNERAGKV